MSDTQFQTPVAFIVFNRPELTARTFAAIAQVQPRQLLIIADGPRPTRKGDAERCAAVRSIVEKITWPCEVQRIYAETNMGCKHRVSSGLSEVFRRVEEAIILEDDCLPHPTFFPFCQELLERYRHDERVMMISGDNFQGGQRRSNDSYYFSRLTHIWGWASWRRAWNHYDSEMKRWPTVRDEGWLGDILGNQHAEAAWRQTFQKVYDGKIDTWDYQWTFACWINNGLTVLPNSNLISNLGFGADATHTTQSRSQEQLPVEAMRFPLSHPFIMVPDNQADTRTMRSFFRTNLLRRIGRKVCQIASRVTGS